LGAGGNGKRVLFEEIEIDGDWWRLVEIGGLKTLKNI
jgi:hypothetical protein